MEDVKEYQPAIARALHMVYGHITEYLCSMSYRIWQVVHDECALRIVVTACHTVAAIDAVLLFIANIVRAIFKGDIDICISPGLSHLLSRLTHSCRFLQFGVVRFSCRIGLGIQHMPCTLIPLVEAVYIAPNGRRPAVVFKNTVLWLD